MYHGNVGFYILSRNDSLEGCATDLRQQIFLFMEVNPVRREFWKIWPQLSREISSEGLFNGFYLTQHEMRLSFNMFLAGLSRTPVGRGPGTWILRACLGRNDLKWNIK